MKAHEFIHEMRTTSAVLGRSAGIRVEFKGDQAATDGTTIWLPSLPQQVDLTLEQVQSMRGFVDHEAGHNKHSDMDRIMSFYDKNQHNGRPELNQLHNCFEDVWMEEKVIRDYPGAAKNLRTALELQRSQEVAQWKSAPEVAKDMLKDQNTAVGAGAIYSKNDYAQGPHTAEAKAWLDPKHLTMGEHYAELSRQCKDSNEVIELAKKAYLYNKKKSTEEQSPEDFDKMAGSGELSDMEGEGKEGGNSLGFGKDGKERQRRAAAALGKALEELAEGKGGVLGELADVLTDATDSAAGGIGKCLDNGLTGGYKVATTEHDIEYRRGVKPPEGASRLVQDALDGTDPVVYNSKKMHLRSDVMTMKNRLRRALMAKQQRDWDFGRERGRLDSKRLVAASQGMKQVYKQRTDREDFNTAISILVDMSGSMLSREKSEIATECAIALAECFEGSGLNYRVAGFCNKRGANLNIKGKFHRHERLDHVIFKDFEEPLRVAKHAIANIPSCIGGNNSDYDFIDKELYNLSKRPEKRRVLFTISDGSISCRSDAANWEHERLVKENLKFYRRKGVESVAIGLLDDTVRRIYPDYVVVKKVEDLSGSAFGLLTNILFREK